MTTKLNYDDIVSCCNSCSEPEPEQTTTSETTVQSISNDFSLYANAGTTTAMNTPENVFTSTAAPATTTAAPATTTAAPATTTAAPATTTAAPATTTAAPATTTAAPATTTAAPATSTAAPATSTAAPATTTAAPTTTTSNEGFTDLQCRCDEIDYCELKETMCPSITDPFECAARGCERGPNTNNFQCVNPGTVPDTQTLPGLDCNDPELVCNMDRSGNIVYGKCIEDSNGLKNFMSFNGQCVSDNKPIDYYCKDDILQLADPCTGEELPENGTNSAGANLTGLFGNDATTSSSTNNIFTTSASTTTNNATTSAMTNNGTEEGPVGSNVDDMDNYSANNTDNNGDELIYFFHEEGEDGEEVLYQYEFNDERALREQKEIENASKASYDRLKGKKILTNDNGLKYLYDPYTNSLTSFNDTSSVKKRVSQIENRMKFLEKTVEDSSVDLKDANDVRNKLVFPVINNKSGDVVYVSNNFGNGEHPELNTEVNNKPNNTVGEVKVTSEEAKKIIEENEDDVNDEVSGELVESPEEEVKVNNEAEVETEVEASVEAESEGLSTLTIVLIILSVLAVVGVGIFLLHKYGILQKLSKKTNNLVKSNNISLNSNKGVNTVLKNLPRN